MQYLPQWNDARRERARLYDRLLVDAGLTKTGTELPAPVTLLKTSPHAHHIYHQYVIRASERDKLREFLKEHGIGSEIYYPLPLHLQRCFAYLGYAEVALPQPHPPPPARLPLP